MSASEKSNLKTFTLFAADTSGRQVNIIEGVSGFYYYEDIFSPTVTASVTFLDTGNVFLDGKRTNVATGLPLRTNETCEIEIINPAKQTLKLNPGNMFVSRISSSQRDQQKQVITLNMISGEAFTNEFSRVGRRLPPVGTHINVESIVRQELQSDKRVITDTTPTQMAWQGNQKKPFTVIMSLAARTVASEGQSSGFLFYETSEGFNYRSIDSLSAQEPVQEYIYTNVNDSDQLNQVNATKIHAFNMEKIYDTFEALQLGVYSSISYVFDPLRTTITRSNNVITSGNLDKKIAKLGKDSISPEGTLATSPSRIFVGVRDIGALNRTELKEVNIEPDDYMAISPLRYNILLRHVINIVVSSNFNLTAGKCIICNFPELDKNKKDDKLSGKYLIKELCHFISPMNQSLTYLKLVRDTYNEK
jgi:hypothetical protein